MAFKINYHHDVKYDIEDAKYWYNKQQSGLGQKLLFQIKKVISAIVENPYLFQEKYNGIRIAYTSIFPFGVHYFVDEKNKIITILAIFHQSLDPIKGSARI